LGSATKTAGKGIAFDSKTTPIDGVEKMAKSLNETAVTNKLNPFRTSNGSVYVTRTIKDEKGKEVGKEDLNVNSEQGRDFMRLMAAEDLETRGPIEAELKGLLKNVRARAESTLPRDPLNRIRSRRLLIDCTA
jgi:hypothetical protein